MTAKINLALEFKAFYTSANMYHLSMEGEFIQKTCVITLFVMHKSTGTAPFRRKAYYKHYFFMFLCASSCMCQYSHVLCLCNWISMMSRLSDEAKPFAGKRKVITGVKKKYKREGPIELFCIDA